MTAGWRLRHFCHGCYRYAKRAAEAPSGKEGPADLQTWHATALQALGRSHAEHAVAGDGAGPGPGREEGSGSPRPRSTSRAEKRTRKEPKTGKKHRRHRRERGEDGQAAYAAAQADLLVALRAERLEREAAESVRQRQVLAAQQTSGPGRGYHNTYGYGRK